MKVKTRKIIYLDVWEHKALIGVLQDKCPRILEIDNTDAKYFLDKLEGVLIKNIEVRNFIKDLRKELNKINK